MRLNPLSSSEIYETLGKVVLEYCVAQMTWQKSTKHSEGILVISTKDGILIGLDVKFIKEQTDGVDQESLYVFSFMLSEDQSIDCM